MTAHSPNRLTAWDARSRINLGTLSARKLTHACLERISLREGEVGAWATLDANGALAQADAIDSTTHQQPLRGIPVGIKDIFDTFDLPTQMGSPIYDGHRPAADAAVVARLREAGAVILGKTVTSEFAGMAASTTRNPLDPAHTPGGSSSGSAAAVADFMVPLALGTQTGGSVLRPASYCGVVGFKPTYGRINRAGIKFAAESLDTVGWMARSVQDIALLDAVLSDRTVEDPIAIVPKRVGVCRTHLWEAADAGTWAALQAAEDRLQAAGVEVDAFLWPDEYGRLSEVREILNNYERARALAHEWRLYRDLFSEPLARSITRGLQIAHVDYLQACRVAERLRSDFERRMEGFDALITPCVNGEAPLGLEYSGDPRFQSIWTLLHVPALTVPVCRGTNRLPIGIQLIGQRYSDSHLLCIGRWVAEQFETLAAI